MPPLILKGNFSCDFCQYTPGSGKAVCVDRKKDALYATLDRGCPIFHLSFQWVYNLSDRFTFFDGIARLFQKYDDAWYRRFYMFDPLQRRGIISQGWKFRCLPPDKSSSLQKQTDIISILGCIFMGDI